MSGSQTSGSFPLPDVLAFLGIDADEARRVSVSGSETERLDLLDRLIAAYARRVPWESASRIARRIATPQWAHCPRWPERFWAEAMTDGTGGTCFESNYAFFSLLAALGYAGYFTINNMGDSIGVHTALIILLGTGKWLVDVGYPVFAAVPVDSTRPTERRTPLMHYTLRPEQPGVYQLQRMPHPKPVAYTLIDLPIAEANYRQALTDDYGPNGLFLDQVVINKVVGGLIHRFSSAEQPYHLQTFRDGARTDTLLGTDLGEVSSRLATHFGLAAPILHTALAHVAS